jgi:type IV pilus assembly protein PilM
LRVPLVYKETPLFGCDIGSHSVKVAQLGGRSQAVRVEGYGHATFPPGSVVQGIVVDPQNMAGIIAGLLAQPQSGRISAGRAAISVPVSKVFIRALKLPAMSAADLEQAVKLEVEQYVPVPVNDLYMHYEVVAPAEAPAKTAAKQIEVLMVAAPKAIVDSYLKVFDHLNLFVETVEMSLGAIARAMSSATLANQTTLLVDIGSESADLTIFDQIFRLTATIPVGGDLITGAIVKTLGISAAQAEEIKTKFGVSDSGLKANILTAVQGHLDTLVAEMAKAVKFYQERSQNTQKISSVALAGGSANMPGLVDYLNSKLGLPITIGNPWINLQGEPPAAREAPMYTAAIGLALLGVKP